MTAPSDRNPAQVAITRARARWSGVIAAIMDSEMGKRMPAAMPPTACAKIIISVVGASAARTEPTTLSAAPAYSSFLRPNRSPRSPQLSSNTTMPIRNMPAIHVRPAPEVWNSAAKVPLRAPGSALVICARVTAL